MSRQTVFKGKLICSGRNPELEAEKWLSQQYISQSHIWLLGLGAGFHLDALAYRFPKNEISVVEYSEELASHYELQFANVQVICAKNWAEFSRSDGFKKFSLVASDKLNFYPAQQTNPEFYKEILLGLNAQTVESFYTYSRLLNITWNALEQRVKSMQTFNIKEIDSAFDGQAANKTKKIFSVLKELVR